MDDESTLYLPRKSLGDRNRSQGHKFLKLSKLDTNQRFENLQWAEQSARQAILYDYTNFQNWELLLKLKNELGDEAGIYSLLEDLLTVLGKDSELIKQLKNIDIIPSCFDLFSSILKREPLDADIWWNKIESNKSELDEFINRCKKMDFRDRRSNVVFGRRLERIRRAGLNDVFSELMPYLLSHRPDNYELWIELGKHHESLKDYKNAWLCYDQVLQFKPRDENKSRLSKIILLKFEKLEGIKPTSVEMQTFHSRLEKLAKSMKNIDDAAKIEAEIVSENKNNTEQKLSNLIEFNEFQEAFFMARSLLSEGELWAQTYFEKAKEGLMNE
ncbi:MAG: hypothetical protein VYE59_04080 [Candidatus Thermoplasmatota archaeon]|nr:hypothetical protein [Candidatus Thermoplasmatota archaeon]